MRILLTVATMLFPLLATAQVNSIQTAAANAFAGEVSTAASDEPTAPPSGDELFVAPRHEIDGSGPRSLDQRVISSIERSELSVAATTQEMTSRRWKTWIVVGAVAAVVVIAVVAAANHAPKVNLQGMSGSVRTLHGAPLSFTFAPPRNDSPRHMPHH